MFGRRRKWPIPGFLPATCGNCGKKLSWQVVTWMDPNIREEKVDHYHASCACGEEHYRDGRGQVVEPARDNLPPDRSDFAVSPQGQQWFPGTAGYVEAEAKAAEQAKQAAAAAAAKAAAAKAQAAAPGAGAQDAPPGAGGAATAVAPPPAAEPVAPATEPATPAASATEPAAPAAEPTAPAAEAAAAPSPEGEAPAG